MPRPVSRSKKDERDSSHLRLVGASSLATEPQLLAQEPLPHEVSDKTTQGRRSAGASSGEPEQSEFDDAREIALRRLTAGPKTRRVLTRDLLKRGVRFNVANDVVNRLAEVGLIDDAAFANAWVSTRHSGRGLARRALRSELRMQGVDDEVVSEAVENLTTEDEYARAKQLVERKLRFAKELDGDKQLRRLTGMLQRKGYGLQMISAVLNEVMRKPA